MNGGGSREGRNELTEAVVTEVGAKNDLQESVRLLL